MVQFKSSEPASDYLFRTTRRAPPWRLGVKLASRAFIHADDFGSRACTEAHTEIEQIDFNRSTSQPVRGSDGLQASTRTAAGIRTHIR
jgi:hypothetical protein